MSTDALAALKAAISDAMPHDMNWPVDLHGELAARLSARGVVVLPVGHPLRTGEPSEAMSEAARKATESWVETLIWSKDDQRAAMAKALRAALAVLRV